MEKIMIHEKGQNLIEFAIILGLVGVACLACFFILGNHLTVLFSDTSKEFKSYNPFQFNSSTQLTSQKTANKSINGSTPIISTPSSNGMVNLQIGNITLQNVPTNLKEIVQTTGASGGTETIASLLSQIADQAEEANLSPDDASLIRDIANYAHTLALLEKHLENTAISCDFEPDCITTYSDREVSIPGVKENATERNFSDYLCLGEAKYKYIYKPDDFNDRLQSKYTAYQYYAKMAQLLESNTADPAIVRLVDELSANIAILGEEFDNNYGYLEADWSTFSYYDYKTNNSYSEKAPSTIELIKDNFKNYTTSATTNLDAQLICATGEKSDDGTSCN